MLTNQDDSLPHLLINNFEQLHIKLSKVINDQIKSKAISFLFVYLLIKNIYLQAITQKVANYM